MGYEMPITLLGREFTAVLLHQDHPKVEEDGGGWEGIVNIKVREIYLVPEKCGEPLEVLLHELGHAYLYFTGCLPGGAPPDWTNEMLVDRMASFIMQLMVENGTNILHRLSKWTRSKARLKA